MYKRIFDSKERLEWLAMQRPFNTLVTRTKQGDAFKIIGKLEYKKRIDEFVDKYCSD